MIWLLGKALYASGLHCQTLAQIRFFLSLCLGGAVGSLRFQVSIAGPVRDDAGVPDSLDPSMASLLQFLVIELTSIVYNIYHQYAW